MISIPSRAYLIPWILHFLIKLYNNKNRTKMTSFVIQHLAQLACLLALLLSLSAFHIGKNRRVISNPRLTWQCLNGEKHRRRQRNDEESEEWDEEKDERDMKGKGRYTDCGQRWMNGKFCTCLVDKFVVKSPSLPLINNNIFFKKFKMNSILRFFFYKLRVFIIQNND